MAKASTIIRSFNGGEWSPTVEGRVDIEKYPSSLRESVNGILTPQGAWVGRSGTMLVQPAYDETKPSTLIPFVHSVDQSLMLEFTDFRIAFLDEDGVVGQAPVEASVTTDGTYLTFTFYPGLPDTVFPGSTFVVTGAPPSSNLNGLRLRVSYTGGVQATVIRPPQVVNAGFDGHFTVTPAYSIASPFSTEDAVLLRYVSQLDEIRLMTPRLRPYKLQRYGPLDWRIAPIFFTGGPFLPVNRGAARLTYDKPGSLVPPTLSNNTVGYRGETIVISGTGASAAYQAFDALADTYYEGSIVDQQGEISVEFGIPTVLGGYAFSIPSGAANGDYATKDYAPMTFDLLGSVTGGTNPTDYEVVDQQLGYVLFDNFSSEYFPVNTTKAYKKFTLRVRAVQRNGPIHPRISSLRLGSALDGTGFDLSSTIGTNGDAGLLPTDVGRLLSAKGSDGRWRNYIITQVSSPTHFQAAPQGDTFPDAQTTGEFKLSYWSDTTGWPLCGTFFQDRLWYGGAKQYPNLLCGSAIGDYDNFASTDFVGAVLDDNAFVGQLNARKVPSIAWISADQRGLLIGTSSGEWALTGDTNGVITAKTALARNATARGCAAAEAVRIDAQVLYIQKARKTIREYAYQFQTDGYKSPSMSLFAAHLGAQPFLQIEYAAEPNSVVWARRLDGTVKALTYNREEDVIGWHSHDFAGMFVESIAVKPSIDGTTDVLWLAGVRMINGVKRRVIERLVKAWDYDQQADPASAHYLDCGLRYTGAPVSVLFGLPHLEGQTVYGLADGIPTGPLDVTGGSVTLSAPASTVALGLGFDAYFRTARIEGGAADGTAQGKTKRLQNLSFRMWQSCDFLFGVEGAGLVQAVDPNQQSLVGQPGPLYTGDIGPLTPDPIYERTGSVTVKRDKSVPLPFNVLAIMPQFLTQDR
jgi:hypothetical protein